MSNIGKSQTFVTGDEVITVGKCFMRDTGNITHHYRQDADRVLHTWCDKEDNSYGINILDKYHIQNEIVFMERTPALIFKNELRKAREILK